MKWIKIVIRRSKFCKVIQNKNYLLKGKTFFSLLRSFAFTANRGMRKFTDNERWY